jgi:hypothetical protein
MSSYSLQHDNTSCSYCEEIPADAYRRHWKHQPKAGRWHLLADGPDLAGRLPRQAHFLTILAYQVGSDGSPAHYYGPFYAEFDAEDTARALVDLRQCVELLHIAYDCALEAPHLWHSGGRGFHLTIPPLVFGAEAGHPQLPWIYACITQQLFPFQVAPTLDRSIYSMGRGRMWRLPNLKRTDTSRYKVPLYIREVLYKPYAALEALTLRPRKGIVGPPADELFPCPGLVQLYQETTAAVERAASVCPPHTRDDSPHDGDVDVLLKRCAFLRHCRDDAATLPEPEWYSMVSNIARCRHGAEAVHRLSAPYPGYSPQETEQKIAHALADAGPHTCAFIQALGFRGCPPGGCGVKAPIGLSRPSGLKSLSGKQSDTGYAPLPALGGLYGPSALRMSCHTAKEGRYV